MPLEPCYALLGLTGTMLSPPDALIHPMLCTEIHLRVKEQLKSGQMVVPGDQWPIFLYASSMYDPNKPWDGLLRNEILVSVRVNIYFSVKQLIADGH